MQAWIWFGAAVLLSLAEALGGQFVLLMLGGGALAAAVLSIFVPLVWLQLLVFALVSVALLIGGRPVLLRHFRAAHQIASGVDALIGTRATVVSTVNFDGGQVKIGGEVWSAKGLEGERPMPPGTPVTVVEVRGATAVVIWGP